MQITEFQAKNVISGLPPIPSNVRIRQQRTNLIILSWNKPGRPIDDIFGKNQALYAIEERFVLGPWYLEHRLTSWALRDVSIKPHATLDGGFKRGHWYQFRVAAINEHGSRGYSQPSRPLMTKGNAAFLFCRNNQRPLLSR